MRVRPSPLALVAAAIGLAGLTACQDPPARDAQLPGYSFDYHIQNREAIDLIQVFDDGRKTYLQFADPSAAPVISDERGAALMYEHSALFIIVEGRHRRLTVDSHGGQSLIVSGTASTPNARPTPMP